MVPTTLLVAVPLYEIFFVFKFKRNGEDDQQFLHDLVVNAFREVADVVPVLPYNVWMRSILVLWDEFGDVVDLEVVLDSGDQVSNAGRLPAVVVSLLERGTVWCFICI